MVRSDQHVEVAFIAGATPVQVRGVARVAAHLEYRFRLEAAPLRVGVLVTPVGDRVRTVTVVQPGDHVERLVHPRVGHTANHPCRRLARGEHAGERPKPTQLLPGPFGQGGGRRRRADGNQGVVAKARQLVVTPAALERQLHASNRRNQGAERRERTTARRAVPVRGAGVLPPARARLPSSWWTRHA